MYFFVFLKYQLNHNENIKHLTINLKNIVEIKNFHYVEKRFYDEKVRKNVDNI